MVSATFTGLIITSFENSLAVLPVLTAYIPMLMDTGGNCGSQSSVTVIRASPCLRSISRHLPNHLEGASWPCCAACAWLWPIL